MIEIYLKYDNMHIFGMINAFNCINNHVISCINSMLSKNTYHVRPCDGMIFDVNLDENMKIMDSVPTKE